MARASGSYPEGRWFDSTRRYHKNGRIAQLGEHLPYKQRVIGSSPIAPTIFICGLVVQLVRMPACHAGGRRFEPVPGRQLKILFEAIRMRNCRTFGKVRMRSKLCEMQGARCEFEAHVLRYVSENEQSSNTAVRAIDEHGGCRQVVKTQDCDSCIRGFESHHPPH